MITNFICKSSKDINNNIVAIHMASVVKYFLSIKYIFKLSISIYQKQNF